jgi:hypothetical protein
LAAIRQGSRKEFRRILDILGNSFQGKAKRRLGRGVEIEVRRKIEEKECMGEKR